ncbi:MAG TPA: tetratricopeptide repeat protein [Fimbriimonadales bacterium]|nr:tetratricopeptide repeat protein [Fimbriimonadales bacterium]
MKLTLCSKCFSEIEPQALYCPECGAAQTDEPATEGSDLVVYPEIARANLLRMKGDSIGAEKVCINILRRYPNNATAHVLLGDVYFDKGDLNQALQWYEMAKDLSPENPSLDLKIERVKKSLKEQESKVAISDLKVKENARATFWFYGIAVVAIIGLSGLAYYLGVERTKKSSEEAFATYTRPIEIPTPSTNNPAPKEQTPPPQPITPTNAIGMTARESNLLSTISAGLKDSRYRIAHVQLDWKEANAYITLAGAQADQQSDQITLVTTAKLAMDAASEITGANVRIIDETTKENRATGWVTRSALQAATSAEGTSQWAQEVLSASTQTTSQPSG